MAKTQGKNARGSAALVLAATILVATLYGSHRSLLSLYHQTQVSFAQGAALDGFSIQGDLDRRLEVSQNLTTLAGKHLPAEAAAQVQADRSALSAAKGPAAKYRANQALTQSTDTLLQRLEALPLPDQDARLRSRIAADLKSANDTMSHDPYNAKAMEYNSVLSAFPANILHTVTGVPKAELFG